MAIARLEVITHPRPGDPPKDYTTNTFHFTSTLAPMSDAVLQDLADKFSAMWKRDIPDGKWQFMAQRSHEVKVYDRADAPPRPIRGHATFTPSFPKTDELYPREVALVLSFYSDRNLPRKRGRIYVGPFDQSGFTMKSRPDDNTMNQVLSLGPLLQGLATSTTGVFTHAVYSTRDLAAHEISNYWVNDEWDTVRRRGVKESKRFHSP